MILIQSSILLSIVLHCKRIAHLIKRSYNLILNLNVSVVAGTTVILQRNNTLGNRIITKSLNVNSLPFWKIRIVSRIGNKFNYFLLDRRQTSLKTFVNVHGCCNQEENQKQECNIGLRTCVNLRSFFTSHNYLITFSV